MTFSRTLLFDNFLVESHWREKPSSVFLVSEFWYGKTKKSAMGSFMIFKLNFIQKKPASSFPSRQKSAASVLKAIIAFPFIGELSYLECQKRKRNDFLIVKIVSAKIGWISSKWSHSIVLCFEKWTPLLAFLLVVHALTCWRAETGTERAISVVGCGFLQPSKSWLWWTICRFSSNKILSTAVFVKSN